MNSKQIGCIIVLVGILAVFQFGQHLRQKAAKMRQEAEQASGEETSLGAQLEAERKVMEDLQRQSKGLLDFVEGWKPLFAVIDEQQAAETGISMKVRETQMLNLSQRYEVVPHQINNQPNASLPTLVRSTLAFDDSYDGLLNWFGKMEKIRPTMRVGRIVLGKGSRAGDLRMDLVLELPLRKP